LPADPLKTRNVEPKSRKKKCKQLVRAKISLNTQSANGNKDNTKQLQYFTTLQQMPCCVLFVISNCERRMPVSQLKAAGAWPPTVRQQLFRSMRKWAKLSLFMA